MGRLDQDGELVKGVRRLDIGQGIGEVLREFRGKVSVETTGVVGRRVKRTEPDRKIFEGPIDDAAAAGSCCHKRGQNRGEIRIASGGSEGALTVERDGRHIQAKGDETIGYGCGFSIAAKPGVGIQDRRVDEIPVGWEIASGIPVAGHLVSTLHTRESGPTRGAYG